MEGTKLLFSNVMRKELLAHFLWRCWLRALPAQTAAKTASPRTTTPERIYATPPPAIDGSRWVFKCPIPAEEESFFALK